MIDVRTGRKAPVWREDSLRRLGLAKTRRRKAKPPVGEREPLVPVDPLKPEPPLTEEH